MLPTHESLVTEMAPPGVAGQVTKNIHRKDDLHAAYWNFGILCDACGQAATIWELRKYNGDIDCLSGVKIPEYGHTVSKVSSEGT